MNVENISNPAQRKKLLKAGKSHLEGKKKALTPGRVTYLIFAYLFLAFIVIVSAYPIIWVIMSSFKSNAAILGSPFSLPDTFNLDAYISVVNQYSFGTYALNSLITAGGSTIVSIVFYAMAAYVIAMFIVCWRIVKYMSERDAYLTGGPGGFAAPDEQAPIPGPVPTLPDNVPPTGRDRIG